MGIKKDAKEIAYHLKKIAAINKGDFFYRWISSSDGFRRIFRTKKRNW